MADGKHMTREAADYIIDEALAAGVLDSDGCLNFRVRGTREEIVATIMETTASWGRPMSRAEAEQKADEAIRVAMPLWVQLAFWAVMLASLAYIIASAWGR